MEKLTFNQLADKILFELKNNTGSGLHADSQISKIPEEWGVSRKDFNDCVNTLRYKHLINDSGGDYIHLSSEGRQFAEDGGFEGFSNREKQEKERKEKVDLSIIATNENISQANNLETKIGNRQTNILWLTAFLSIISLIVSIVTCNKSNEAQIKVLVVPTPTQPTKQELLPQVIISPQKKDSCYPY